jgi:hypothetical protein
MENVKINRRCIAFPKPIHQYGEISIAKFCTKGGNGLNNQQRNQNSCRPPQLTAHKQTKKCKTSTRAQTKQSPLAERRKASSSLSGRQRKVCTSRKSGAVITPNRFRSNFLFSNRGNASICIETGAGTVGSKRFVSQLARAADSIRTMRPPALISSKLYNRFLACSVLSS